MIPKSAKAIVGKRFGKLIVMRVLPRRKSGAINLRTRVLVQCDCSNRISIPKYYLTRKPNPRKDCGLCNRNTKDKGGKFAIEYSIWSLMQKRCYDPKHVSYSNYGAKGVRVCADWLRSFDLFIQAVGPRPSPNHSIDRIDPTGNYEPDNVRWATAKEQAANKRKKVK